MLDIRLCPHKEDTDTILKHLRRFSKPIIFMIGCEGTSFMRFQGFDFILYGSPVLPPVTNGVLDKDIAIFFIFGKAEVSVWKWMNRVIRAQHRKAIAFLGDQDDSEINQQWYEKLKEVVHLLNSSPNLEVSPVGKPGKKRSRGARGFLRKQIEKYAIFLSHHAMRGTQAEHLRWLAQVVEKIADLEGENEYREISPANLYQYYSQERKRRERLGTLQLLDSWDAPRSFKYDANEYRVPERKVQVSKPEPTASVEKVEDADRSKLMLADAPEIEEVVQQVVEPAEQEPKTVPVRPSLSIQESFDEFSAAVIKYQRDCENTITTLRKRVEELEGELEKYRSIMSNIQGLKSSLDQISSE